MFNGITGGLYGENDCGHDHIDIMPVLLGEGLRLFDHLSDQAITLEKIKVLETPIRTSLRFRVVKER